MKEIVPLVVFLAVALAACGESSPSSEPEAVEQPSPEPTPGCESLPLNEIAYPKGSPVLEDGSGIVPAQANIFSAGRDAALAPGAGGAGVLPPVVLLPEGASRVITFPSITGKVTPIFGGAPFNGAAGDRSVPTDVESLLGISGVVNRTNGMFLVGVFLTDEEPSDPAPPRLDFSRPAVGVTGDPIGEEFGELAPEIGQTFLIGDGKGRSYVVPAEATRLFLGFADAYAYEGCPGWYGNNDGELEVRVEVSEG